MSILKYVTVNKNERVKVDDAEYRNCEQDVPRVMASEKQQQANQIKEKKGDLFSCPASEALAHCISADVKMGKGIAVLFKEKFNGVQDLIKQGKKPGEVAVLRTDTRFIYYLVTKEKYWQKPTYKTVHRSLEDMVKHCQDNNVTHVSMPKIGCGLDRLEWPKVLQILNDVTKNTDIEVTVYELAK